MAWLAALIVLLLIQALLAAIVWYDARRQSLDNAFAYWYGSMIPVVGYLVMVVYLGRREEEPRSTRTTPAVDPPAEGIAWRIELPDPLGLPRRIAIAILGLWWRFWLLLVVALPITLVAGAVLIHPRLNIAALSLVGAIWLFLFVAASQVRDAVFTIDRGDGKLRQEYAGGVLFSGDSHELAVDSDSIARVRAVPAGRYTVCRLAYEQPLFSTGPPAVVVEEGQTDDVLTAFEQADITTETAGASISPVWVTTTVMTLAVLPVVSTWTTGEVGGNTLFFFGVLAVGWLVAQVVSGIRRSDTDSTTEVRSK